MTATTPVPTAAIDRLRQHVVRTYEGPPDRGLMLAARAVIDSLADAPAEPPAPEGEASECACGPIQYPGTDAPLEECPVHGGAPPSPTEPAEDEPITADHLRNVVLKWASRFQPGDAWDIQDTRDLETALGGTVENRCHHRDVDKGVRVATSLDDLRVGQVVAWQSANTGRWNVCHLAKGQDNPAEWESVNLTAGELVILSEPDLSPAPTPAEQAWEAWDGYEAGGDGVKISMTHHAAFLAGFDAGKEAQ